MATIAISIFEDLFPELNARCKRIQATEISKSKALIFHLNLEVFFKKIIHFHLKNNLIGQTLSLMILNNENKRAETIIYLHLNIVRVHDLEKREKRVWKDFFINLCAANSIKLIRNIKRSDCKDFALPHKPEDCPYGDTFLALRSFDKKIDEFKVIFQIYIRMQEGKFSENSIFNQFSFELIKRIVLTHVPCFK
ncbi:MAG: hypothetical protein H0W50_11035 [Parachlamydiaceae bacterium]|nr:hypothetical protein [Parachlamydiaceae bacterium]